jgi:uncharacterized delta-60 repeat protein
MARLLALLAVGLAMLPAAATAAPGDFDTSFDGDGMAALNWGALGDSAREVLVQPDGRLLLAGVSGTTPSVLAAARLNPNGTPDTSFSFDGLASFALDGRAGALGAARQPDGKIVAVGHTSVNAAAGTTAVVMRLNPDGTPDGSFGVGGVARLDYATEPAAWDVVVQRDGKIVAVGGTGAGPDYNAMVTRLTPQGVPDSSFDGDGTAVLDLGGIDNAEAVALQPDGKLVVGGNTDFDRGLWVARLNPDGSPDASFGLGGLLPLPAHTGDAARDVLVQPDGRIVVIGAGDDFVFSVTRLTPNGSADETFGQGEGTVPISFDFSSRDTAEAAVLQANGKIVVAGHSTVGPTNWLSVARLQPGGSLDTTFSSDGRQSVSTGTSNRAYGVALQPDGRIVVAGTRDDDALVVRLDGDPPAVGGGPPPGGPGGGPGGGSGGGKSVPRCAGKRATIVGTNRSERLKGTRRADVIVALGGNDKIAAGKGNDLICGGNGNDSVDGGLGNDRLFGQDGKDKLAGAAGKDSLSGGGGKDSLKGGGGKDSCTGNAGADNASCERARSL